MPPLAAGSPAPAFTLPDTHGERWTLERLTARAPALLAFYKSECPTCALAFPFLVKLQRAYPELRVVGVAQNEAPEATRFAASHGAAFPQLIDDPFYFTSAAYGIDFTPTLVLSEGGRVVEVVEAWSRERWNALSRRIAKRIGVPYHEVSAAGDGAPLMRPG